MTTTVSARAANVTSTTAARDGTLLGRGFSAATPGEVTAGAPGRPAGGSSGAGCGAGAVVGARGGVAVGAGLG